MRNMRLGCQSRRVRRRWVWVVVLSLVLVFSVAIRYPELPRTLGSAIAADFLRPPPDEVDGRKFVTSAVVGVSWLIAVGLWGHMHRWPLMRWRKFGTVGTSVLVICLVVWGMQLPWSWSLTAALVVVPLAWFNLGGLLALQEAAASERRQRMERSKAAESAKTSVRRAASGAGDRERADRTTTREPGDEG